MGLGLFILFALCLLLPATAALLIYFFVSKKKIALLVIPVIWSFPILLIGIGSILNEHRRPIRLTKLDIVGEYRIDTKFYPGINSQWQYNHYKFYITHHDSILFIVMKEKEIPVKFFWHKIIYSDGPPDLWEIETDSTHHVIRNQPTLYRGHSKFYYVFKSDFYGNMYFRKVVK